MLPYMVSHHHKKSINVHAPPSPSIRQVWFTIQVSIHTRKHFTGEYAEVFKNELVLYTFLEFLVKSVIFVGTIICEKGKILGFVLYFFHAGFNIYKWLCVAHYHTMYHIFCSFNFHECLNE